MGGLYGKAAALTLEKNPFDAETSVLSPPLLFAVIITGVNSPPPSRSENAPGGICRRIIGVIGVEEELIS